MNNNRSYYPFDDETDRIPLDDEVSAVSDGEHSTLPMDEEEARSYSSVYDVPFTFRTGKSRPKQ